jgi:shikimate 5-dehydrogenase
MAPKADESPVMGPIHADVVFDMVYTPKTTRLVQLAHEQGKTVIPGTTMFYAQAERQFEMWTGRAAPSEIYRAEHTS